MGPRSCQSWRLLGGWVPRGSAAGKQRAAWSPASSVHGLRVRVKPEDKAEAGSGGASFSVITPSAGDVPWDPSHHLSKSYFPSLKNEGGVWDFWCTRLPPTPRSYSSNDKMLIVFYYFCLTFYWYPWKRRMIMKLGIKSWVQVPTCNLCNLRQALWFLWAFSLIYKAYQIDLVGLVQDSREGYLWEHL